MLYQEEAATSTVFNLEKSGPGIYYASAEESMHLLKPQKVSHEQRAGSQASGTVASLRLTVPPK